MYKIIFTALVDGQDYLCERKSSPLSYLPYKE